MRLALVDRNFPDANAALKTKFNAENGMPYEHALLRQDFTIVTSQVRINNFSQR